MANHPNQIPKPKSTVLSRHSGHRSGIQPDQCSQLR